MYSITVQVSNTNIQCQKARIIINIQVINNEIKIQSTATLILSEKSSIDTIVGKIEATGGIGPLQYSIVGGNDLQTFRINPTTSQIFLNQTLDYKTAQTYTITIRIMSNGSGSADTNVTVEIQDVNERPTFITPPCATLVTGCTFSIAENSPASVIQVIQGSDPDLQSFPNGVLKYQLSSNTGLQSLPGDTMSYQMSSDTLPFAVLPDGTLSSTRALDRELQSFYTFILTLSDSCSGCSLSTSTVIYILVTDVNDNPPVFSLNPALIQVPEDLQNNTVVGQYAASDADDGNNAAIVFSLAPDHLPLTLSQSGILVLTGEIDYERVQTYYITVTASNPGTNIAVSTNTTIQIQNVDDNTPVITGEPYILNVTENTSIGTLVTTITATDSDLGVHGEIQYTIISGNTGNSFTINSVTGVLTVRNHIDRETVPFYSLQVQASDKGTPQVRMAATAVAITVTDLNDNGPIFNPDVYYVDIKENLAVRTNIVYLLANDADQPNSLNAFILYSITSGNTGNAFSIDNEYIQINNTLDFEMTSFYSLVVEGKDSGSPAMSASATISITVIDVNENIPTITGDQPLNISESTPVNSSVAIFLPASYDSTFTILITSGNYNNTFDISSTTATIIVSAPLDYENISFYLLIITASNGTLTTNYPLAIHIQDENEFSPTFDNTSEFELNEGNPRDTVVGVVMATDADSDDKINYEIVNGGPGLTLFCLNSSTGVITTQSQLDREALTSIFLPPLSQITITVATTDNGSPSRSTLKDYTITLVDANDNSPTFSNTIYSNQLRENLSPGQVVFYTSATDRDLGTNANITYSFVLTNNQGSSNPFLINSQTGTIITATSLDYDLQTFYLFSITATDAGSPPMSSTVIGNLTLIDENDNSPVFSQSAYIMTVTEDFVPGILNTFTATDNDQGTSGEIEYAILSSSSTQGSNDVGFSIDKDTGALRTTTNFNYEVSSQVNVTIIATDQGLPRQSASATVIINILNVDEEKPQFQTASCDALISEDAGVGTVVSACIATDSDSVSIPGQSSITYSLTDSLFDINSINGTITTKAALDREINSVVTLSLRAIDASGLVSTNKFNIFLLDINDNLPQFSNTPYNFYYTEESIAQYKQEFLTVSATDLDLCENGAVSYSIQNIYRLNDTLTLVEVLAQDGGIPPMATATNVTVSFQSMCQYQTYTITSNEGVLSAHLLCSIYVIPAEEFSMTLGHSANLACHIVRNSLTSYKWLHNGTTFSNPKIIPQNSVKEILHISQIAYTDSGEYACKASSFAGSLQSLISVATIQGR